MTGTLLNIVTVLVGGTFGLLLGARLPDRVSATVVSGLGLFTLGLGTMMFLETDNAIVVLLSLLAGGLIGEWWQIEARLASFGGWLEVRFMRNDQGAEETNRFVRAFLTSSLLFCIGPMTILGSIQDGLTGDYSLLAIKSVLDGFAALAFATTLGPGVLFSVIVILLYQGGLSLTASQAQAIISEPMMLEMTAVGGVMMLGLAISSLLEIRPIRVGNFLPALVIAPILVYLIELLALQLP